MSRRHHQEKKRRHPAAEPSHAVSGVTPRAGTPTLEVVVVADTVGTRDAVSKALSEIQAPAADLRIIHAGLGAVSKSDVTMAATGSRLILGFNVGVNQHVEEEARDLGVEIRLYSVIYELQQDVEEIAAGLSELPPQEKVLGRAEVIALFKSSRKGVILGCEVKRGRLAVGDRFRLIGVAGTEYEGAAESLHIGPDPVREARAGQQVGLKIRDFNKARVGDAVEAFTVTSPGSCPAWAPRGGVFRRS